MFLHYFHYRQNSNISRTLVGDGIVEYLGIVSRETYKRFGDVCLGVCSNAIIYVFHETTLRKQSQLCTTFIKYRRVYF